VVRAMVRPRHTPRPRQSALRYVDVVPLHIRHPLAFLSLRILARRNCCRKHRLLRRKRALPPVVSGMHGKIDIGAIVSRRALSCSSKVRRASSGSRWPGGGIDICRRENVPLRCGRSVEEALHVVSGLCWSNAAGVRDDGWSRVRNGRDREVWPSRKPTYRAPYIQNNPINTARRDVELNGKLWKWYTSIGFPDKTQTPAQPCHPQP